MWRRKKPGSWWMKECPLAYASQAGFVLHYKQQQQSSRSSHLAWHAEQRYSTFFCFLLFQASVHNISKESFRCMFKQNRTSESNFDFNCNSTYSALKLIEEMFYQPLKTRVKMVLLFNVYWTEDQWRLSYLYWNESHVIRKILKG